MNFFSTVHLEMCVWVLKKQEKQQSEQDEISLRQNSYFSMFV